jgi:hopanoid biosynthesis associated protein HpnK
LIVTADDFGLAPEVNEAVELAHRYGVLTSASLMVAAPAAHDAVTRAHHLPTLRVGLHLVLVQGRPALPPSAVPDLVDASGYLRSDLLSLGIDLLRRGKVRQQMAAEITAQFEAYAATGLALDHVDSHQHFHLHPYVTELICRIGAGYGMRAVRAPVEPMRLISRLGGQGLGQLIITNPWARLTRRRLRQRGVVTTDYVFGLAWSGAMTRLKIAALLGELPPASSSELYCHPATSNHFEGAAQGYRYRDEHAALCASSLRQAIWSLGISLVGYADLTRERDRGSGEPPAPEPAPVGGWPGSSVEG